MSVQQKFLFFPTKKNFMPKIIKRLTNNQIKNSRATDKDLSLKDKGELLK